MNNDIDKLESALRTPEPALADDDFSANVLARLPPRRRSPARRWTLAGAAALGSALTLAIAPPLEDVVASIAPFAIPPLMLSAVAVVAIVTIPALLAFYSDRNDR
jgi:peptidoglycan/LPS O-acetylase OafA/YrhL